MAQEGIGAIGRDRRLAVRRSTSCLTGEHFRHEAKVAARRFAFQTVTEDIPSFTVHLGAFDPMKN